MVQGITSSNGDVILFTEAHTTGTEGLLQYRVYHWNGVKYALQIDLCRIPQVDQSGIPFSTQFFAADTCIDLVDFINTEPLDLDVVSNQITQEEFDATIAAFGELTRLQLQTQTYQPETHTKLLTDFLSTELDTWAIVAENFVQHSVGYRIGSRRMSKPSGR